MKKIRKSNFVKSICILLSCTILYIQCSPEAIAVSNGCTNVPNDAISTSSTNIVNTFEHMLDLGRTLQHQDNLTTFDEYFDAIQLSEKEALITEMNEEYGKYDQLGHQGYINSISQISSGLKSYLISYSTDLESFILNETPTLEEYKSFISSQKILLSNSSLCEDDKSVVSLYLDLNQGFAQHYYKLYYDGNVGELNNNGVSIRDCNNFWQKLACGSLALIVGTFATVVGVMAALAIIVKSILTVTFTDSNGNTATVTSNDGDWAAILAGLSLGFYAAKNTYQFCCDLFPDEDEVIIPCSPPTNSLVTPVDCGVYNYRVWGGGIYTTTVWTNGNTVPSMITTPQPRIDVTIPDPSTLSTMVATSILCTSGTNITLYPWFETVNYGNLSLPVNLIWTWEPPNSYALGATFNVAVGIEGTMNAANLSVEWSITDPQTNEITGNGTSAAVRIHTSYGALVTATLIDSCTGQPVSTIYEFVSIN